MKLGKLTDTRLHAALRKLGAQPVPLRVAFKLKGVTAKIDEELKKFEECRQSALEKFGNKDAEGKLALNADNTVSFAEGKLQEFVAELNDLGQTDVELPTVTLAEVGDKAELTVEEVMLLDGILVQ